MNQNGHFPNEGTTKDQKQADELNALLDELQAGRVPTRPDDLSADQVNLLLKLNELADHASPSIEYVNQLQVRLQLASQKILSGEQVIPAMIKPGPLAETSQRANHLGRHEILAGIGRMFKMKKNILIPETGVKVRIEPSTRKIPRTLVLIAGTAVIVILLAFLLPKLDWFSPGTSPSAVANLPATATQVLPTITQKVISPSITPTPSIVPTIQPTEIPTIVVIRPEGLPNLAELTGGGVGGSIGSSLTKLIFQLNLNLPEGPVTMPIYQSIQNPLTIANASQAARQLGMQPNLYVFPNDLAKLKTDPKSINTLFAIDGTRKLIFEGSGTYYQYHDDRFSLYYLGHWYPAAQQLSAQQINASAQAFIEKYNLPGVPYLVKPYTGGFPAVQFIQTIDGKYPVFPSVTSIQIGQNGQVGDFTYRSAQFLPVDNYKILSAQEAWELLRNAPSQDLNKERVFYRASAKTFIQCDPQYWKPVYTAGQRADLYGTPELFVSVDETKPAHVTLNQVILTGDVPQEVNPMHIWGVFESAGDYLVLRVEGWEVYPQAEGTWNGVIQRQGDQVNIMAGDGKPYSLLNVPANLPDGSRVFVNGSAVGSKLEWNVIQADMSESDPCKLPGQQPAQILATVEQIDLIYFVPPLEGFSQDYLQVTPDYAQPAWRFRGTTDNGMTFEAWVQAVAPEYLK